MAIREVAPGSSINAAIQASAPGDKVLVKPGTFSTGGITMDRPGVMLEFEPGVKVVASSIGVGRAVRIAASDIQVVGLGKPTERVTFEDFGSGIGSTEVTGRNRVLIKGVNQRRTNYGFWISGDDWTVEDFEVDRIMIRGQAGDADYGRMFGNRHKIRRGWMHGTQIPVDISPGHTDIFQFYNNSGANEVLKDCLIEEVIATDFVQGLFWKNETGNATAMVNNTMRNCVLFGTRGWPSTPNPGNIYHGAPSWGIYARGPQTGLVLENNTLVNCNNYFGFPNGTKATVRKNICLAIGAKLGTVYTLEGTPRDNITAGQNLNWNTNWQGEMAPSSDILNIDPIITGLLGPSGDPFAADALWRPKNLAAAAYGAQIAATTAPPVIPPVTPPTTDYVTHEELAQALRGVADMIEAEAKARAAADVAIGVRLSALEADAVRKSQTESVQVLRVKP